MLFLGACQKSAEIKTPYLQKQEKILGVYQEMIQKLDAEAAPLTDYEKTIAAGFARGVYSLVMESYVEKGNPADPQITDWMRPGRKFAGDNPNTIYKQAFVSDKYTYKIKGKLGNEVYFGLQLYKTVNGNNLPSANTNMRGLRLSPDRSFEIILSKERPEGAVNWIPLAAEDYTYLTRQYFSSRNNINPGSYTIERIDNQPYSDDLAQRMDTAAEKLRAYVMANFEVNGMSKEVSFNKYSDPNAPSRSLEFSGALFPTLDNTYDGFWVSLKPGEAVYLHGRLPKAVYASWVYYNRWYMTPDYRRVNSYRSMDEIKLNADGTYDMYLSPETVKHPNWIDMDKQYEGTFAMRYLLAENREFPEIKVVKIADIK